MPVFWTGPALLLRQRFLYRLYNDSIRIAELTFFAVCPAFTTFCDSVRGDWFGEPCWHTEFNFSLENPLLRASVLVSRLDKAPCRQTTCEAMVVGEVVWASLVFPDYRFFLFLLFFILFLVLFLLLFTLC